MFRNFIFFLLCIHSVIIFTSDHRNNLKHIISHTNHVHFAIEETFVQSKKNKPKVQQVHIKPHETTSLPQATAVSSTTINVEGQPYQQTDPQYQTSTDIDIMIFSAIGYSLH